MSAPMPAVRKPRAPRKPKPEPTLRELLDRKVSEAQLQNDVIDLAVRLGYLWFHAPETAENVKPPSGLNAGLRKSWIEDPAAGKGVPDLLLVRPPSAARRARVLFWELKTERGALRAGQKVWTAALLACGLDCGIETRVVRPSDWSSGRVEEWLR